MEITNNPVAGAYTNDYKSKNMSRYDFFAGYMRLLHATILEKYYLWRMIHQKCCQQKCCLENMIF